MYVQIHLAESELWLFEYKIIGSGENQWTPIIRTI